MKVVKAVTLFWLCLLFSGGLWAAEEAAGLGSGFVVWESNRTGVWRIYSNTLDGKQGERQISPAGDPETDHLSAEVSPDGTRVVYIEFPVSARARNGRPPVGKLHLIDMKTGRDMVLFDKACDYGAGHSAVFADSNTLIYINGNRETCKYDFPSGRSEVLYDNGREDFDLLINGSLTIGVSEHGHIYSYDKHSKKARFIKKPDGCMPYPASDGKHVVWMAHAGGPVCSYEPETDTVKTILHNRDECLPADRNYIYFPELSWNMGALAFGASPNQHDHNKSDYDIFVCRIDKDTLTRIGSPVRYSFDGHTDRYPSVYYEEWELGTRSFEGRTAVSWSVPGEDGNVEWSFGDGTSKKGTGRETHVYTKPGAYTVTAKGKRVYRGTVVIAEPQKPSVAKAVFLQPDTLRLVMSEPVDTGQLKTGLHSGTKIKRAVLSDDRTKIDLTFEGPVDRDTLYLKGIYDLAEEHNRLDVSLVLDRTSYPQFGPVWFYLPDGQPMVRVSGEAEPPILKGRAWYAGNYGLAFAGGRLEADGGFAEAVKRSGAVTVIVDFCPAAQKAFSALLCLANARRNDLILALEQDRLSVRMRTWLGTFDRAPALKLAKVGTGKSLRAAVTYENDVLSLYLDGRPAGVFTEAHGSFESWDCSLLTLGDHPNRDSSFEGVIDSVLIYDRVLSPEEIAAEHRAYRSLYPVRTSRAKRVKAEPVRCSDFPTLEEIAPYTDALVNTEFRTEDGRLIYVICRAYANGEKVYAYEPGRTYSLLLEPPEDNPQAEGIYMSDTLDFDPEKEQFFNAGQGMEE